MRVTINNITEEEDEIYLGKEGGIITGKYVNNINIVDDVVSTQQTFNNAVSALMKNDINGIINFYVVLDRRNMKNNEAYKVTSLFTPQDFGLKP